MKARRAATLHRARAARVVVASPHGLLRTSLAPHLLATRVLALHKGDEMTPEILLEALDEGGYAREDPVTAPGQVARRGGILDVFPSDAQEPVRVEVVFGGAAQQAADQCATVTFTPSQCDFNSTGSSLKCR